MNTGYNQIPQSLQDAEEKAENRCMKIFCWSIQILVWVMILSTIVCSILRPKAASGCAAGLGVFYIIYMVIEFCSPTSHYLCHRRTGNRMYEKMGELFRTHPDICFHCECYHIERRTVTHKDDKGNDHTETRDERVVTFRDNFSIPYYSSRDVSGLFYLNCDEANVQKKNFIKLNLKEEINFADAISYYDYEFYKRDFWIRNRFRDVYMDFNETRTIPGLNHYNLVSIGNQDPKSVNFCFYFLSVMFTFCQFYKSYVDSFCVEQKFTVRKFVSTRYDLNQPVYVQKYTQFVPTLNLITQTYNYETNDYNYLNQDKKVDLPTEEELENAKKYENKVPDYTISSGGGAFHAGVIEDNPSYSSFDYNSPPPEFASVAGNVGLNASQINVNGQAPAGFGQPGFQFSIAPSVEGGYSSAGQGQGQGYSSAQGQGQGYSSAGQGYSSAGQGYNPPNY